MKAEIYSKDNCVFCTKAKLKLEKHNPKILMLNKDYTMEDFFSKFPNAKTFPQIIINNSHIGGYRELKNWLDQNTFDENF